MNLKLFSAKLIFVQNYESNSAENLQPAPVQKDIFSPDLLPISPNNPPWNSWTAFGVWVASVAFIVIFPNIFLLPYLANQNINFTDQATIVEFAKTDPTAILLQIAAVIPAHVFTLILVWLIVTRIRKYSFRETLGWRWNGFNFWNCLIILGGFYILSAVVSSFIPEQDNDLLRILRSSRTAVYIVAFLATFTAPLVEEVVYRGVLYSAFQRSLGIPAAVLITTFLFALVHVPQYWGSPGTIFLICLLSLILTLIRVRTGNLLPCIALHTVFNGTQSLMLILQPYVEKYMEKQPEQASLIHFLYFQFFN